MSEMKPNLEAIEARRDGWTNLDLRPADFEWIKHDLTVLIDRVRELEEELRELELEFKAEQQRRYE